ncbi:spermidine/putrescine transport system ATP-binding protein/putrescine transport system ATP-binding protein [Tistlia consotensis]|uniref:Spermidine/putrescine import ATP-binding protein PotA n=1 Tax=Tistlia consotensis USBA 355 TaxID=560819 RepID=A0A1Y6BZQ5_9PROT|nr:ABC transporter ATP-binding protein [Tistlia consotensis]SMF38230.1 spermidine/putrescine transport system ATP-binding protein/putrescine transport system ATP-binding protein [Tistlia consotensis USBA 355]SNR37300.1 spermidine/putrescine transport system ATP-binding protein/putrescine transport system ATP-binding protein [Tistlia consotensis]
MSDAIISIQGVTKRFGEVTAVERVDLDIRAGEFFALLGPSGCGKTTLLRMLAGFEQPSEGRILIGGQDMTGVQPNHRPVNMVFQSYAVFPHMTVFDNVAYGLKVAHTPRGEIAPRVKEALAMVQLSGYEARKPDQLSGGQRQRVALARALVKRPKVLLLDEPLSALDAKLREAMQIELVRLQQTVGITFVIVTHDQDEALSMADRIAVMESGHVRQVASPQTLYEFPSGRFVADFIGKMNLFEGKVVAREAAGLSVEVEGLGRLELPADERAPAPGRAVGIAVRPEKVELTRSAPPEGSVARRGTVTQVAYYGDVSYVFLDLEDGPALNANVINDERAAEPHFVKGETLWAAWNPRDFLVLGE